MHSGRRAARQAHLDQGIKKYKTALAQIDGEINAANVALAATMPQWSG